MCAHGSVRSPDSMKKRMGAHVSWLYPSPLAAAGRRVSTRERGVMRAANEPIMSSMHFAWSSRAYSLPSASAALAAVFLSPITVRASATWGGRRQGRAAGQAPSRGADARPPRPKQPRTFDTSRVHRQVAYSCVSWASSAPSPAEETAAWEEEAARVCRVSCSAQPPDPRAHQRGGEVALLGLRHLGQALLEPRLHLVPVLHGLEDVARLLDLRRDGLAAERRVVGGLHGGGHLLDGGEAGDDGGAGAARAARRAARGAAQRQRRGGGQHIGEWR